MAKVTKTTIEEIIIAIGGRANIKQFGHCMTRLRLTLNDDQQADQVKIKSINGIIGIVESDDQLQIVLGPGNAQLGAGFLKEIMDQVESDVPETTHTAQPANLNAIAAEQKKQLKAKQTSKIQRFLTTFATIFTPLIPGFIAAGLLLGLATVLLQIYAHYGLTQYMVVGQQKVPIPEYLIYYSITSFMIVFSKGMFGFLAIMVGYNAQKAFGGTGVNGAIIGALFILNFYNINTQDFMAGNGIPVTFNAGMDHFFGLAIEPKGGIIGVLIAAILGAYVERLIRRFIPITLDIILTPTFTLLIMGAISFLVIMPLSYELFKGMTWLFNNLNNNPFGCALLAGVFLVAVMFGIHQGFIPVYLALVATYGYNSLFPILAMAGGGQVGAAIALYLKARQGAQLRNQVRGAIVPGLLGIGEPLIYGVTLPRVKPFITACIGSACGGFLIGMFAWMGMPMGLNSAFGPSGLIAVPLMTGPEGPFMSMGIYLAGLMTSYVAGFIITFFFGVKGVDLE